MADHSELVAEMLMLEQMGTQERQKLAKKRRLQQLKKWSQREKEWLAKEKQMNRRLATIISEENNGLNLKNFTQYPLSERSPQKEQHKSSYVNNINNNNQHRSTGVSINHYSCHQKSNSNNINNNSTSINNNNYNLNGKRNYIQSSKSISLNGLDGKGLTSIYGKVHFDAGVMLLEAAARNDFDEVKRLLELGVSPNSTNHDGLTALHQCCIEASEPMINLLLEYGADVDARDVEQWTPLHAACTCGHLNLVKILVQNGAELLAVNGDGNMPFDLCEDEQTLDYLESQMIARDITQDMIDLARATKEMQMIGDLENKLSNGIDINTIVNENGVTPIHVAAANGYLMALEFLIKHGASVNVCDKDLWQPIHGAACWGNEQHIRIIELLVESGADLYAKTVNDETVFELCDNTLLLNRLNELKDELESKRAASDTDRLKRTQSRTNSRIHSIRRTSVRDKNQISRREAREEALLRVENSVDTTDNVRNDLNGPTNGVKPNLDPKANQDDSNKSNLERSSVIMDLGDTKTVIAAKDKSGSKDDCEKVSNSNETTTIEPPQALTNLVNNRSKICLPERPKPDEAVELAGSMSVTLVNSETKRCADPAYLNPKPTLQNGTSSWSKEETDSSSNGKPDQKTMTSTITINLNPINYTLSNLKKQRSDFRQRITCPGNSGPTRSTNEPDSSLAGCRSILLDPQADQSISEIGKYDQDLGLARNERPLRSPDSCMQKFRGDPSEVIGGSDIVRTDRCCIII